MHLLLVVADAPISWFDGTNWEILGIRNLETCYGADEACSVVAARSPDFVIIDQGAFEAGLGTLETLNRLWPQLPVVLVSDADDGRGMRNAFIRGAFDCLIKPVTEAALAGLATRLRVRGESFGGGVFSSRSTETARQLLFGGSAPVSADALPGGLPAQFWEVAVIEVVPHSMPLPAIEALVDEALAGWLPLGIRELDQERRTMQLVLLFHDRSAERLEQAVRLRTQNLVQRLGEAGAWAAAGLGTAGAAIEAAASLQCARLALGYSLVRDSGVFPFCAEQEAACPTCTDIAPCAEEIPLRIQSGSDWRDLIGQFFETLNPCTSVRRLHQEVQRLFSLVADLVPASPAVEKYYHIADFVHGPRELRAELEVLCSLAASAVRANGRSLAERKLHEFREYVARHYGEQLDLALVCSALQISPSYLSKILRRSLRTTFVDFVTEVRMARSRELLSGTDLLTSQIAERVGFVYSHYFSALFKKRYATTPSKFRAWCRAQAALPAAG